MSRPAPYGSWRSPITTALIAAGEVPLGGVELSGDDVSWLEGKPLEGGRQVLVRWSAAGGPLELTPPGYYLRTRVPLVPSGPPASRRSIVRRLT